VIATTRQQHPLRPWALLPVTIAAILVAAIWSRYPGPWAESDTVTMTRTIRGILSEETISPGSLGYSNGFNYPTFAAIIVDVTGLSAREAQTVLLPWLLPVTALMAFVAFRAITGSERAGAVCALLLLIQPDFLFVTQRGSHEKVTWTLVLMVLFTLVRSIAQRHAGQVAPYIGIMYLGGFAIVCTNVFFASSFVTIFLASFVASVVASFRLFRESENRRIVSRLGYICLTLGILVYLFISTIYPTAASNFESLRSAAERIAVLYLPVETTPVDVAVEPAATSGASGSEQLSADATETSTPAATAINPYGEIGSTWVSRNVYILLTGFTWIMLLYAGIGWMVVAIRFLRQGVTRSDLPLFLAWAFAGVAAAQIVASVAADFAGVFGGNLQLRLFPVFTLFAIPLIVTTMRLPTRPPARSRLRRLAPAFGLVAIATSAVVFPLYTLAALPVLFVIFQYGSHARWPIALRHVVVGFGIIAFTGFAFAAILKATNDPLVSNRWMFYTGSEAAGLNWVRRHLIGELVWTEFDERLKTAMILLADDSEAGFGLGPRMTSGAGAIEESPYLVASDVTAERSLRISRAPPDVRGDDIIYDNGDVQIAHQIPKTPFRP
jgi:hypothetical protein